MTAVDAVKSAYRNYASFEGRAARSDFWWFVLFQIVVAALISQIDGTSQMLTGPGMMRYTYSPGLLGAIWHLVNLLPILALGARRLHDLGKSGWWLLLGLIPMIGVLFLLAWASLRGTAGPNAYGPDPLAA